MPARRDQQSSARTRIAVARVRRGITQADLADALGLSLATYRKLEHGRMDNPPLRYLVNLGIALDVPFSALVEDRWRDWAAISPDRSTPPDRSELWRSAPWAAEAEAEAARIAERAKRRAGGKRSAR
jgi:transcriptional regulator with XRE-family HTH domain